MRDAQQPSSHQRVQNRNPRTPAHPRPSQGPAAAGGKPHLSSGRARRRRGSPIAWFPLACSLLLLVGAVVAVRLIVFPESSNTAKERHDFTPAGRRGEAHSPLAASGRPLPESLEAVLPALGRAKEAARTEERRHAEEAADLTASREARAVARVDACARSGDPASAPLATAAADPGAVAAVQPPRVPATRERTETDAEAVDPARPRLGPCVQCGGKQRLACATCDGRPVARRPCPSCEGKARTACSACAGKGRTACLACEGKKRVTQRMVSELDRVEVWTHDDPCRFCSGRGWLACAPCRRAGKIGCADCRGSGSVEGSCPDCRGAATVACRLCVTPEHCPDCEGKGRRRCLACVAGGAPSIRCDECMGRTEVPCARCSGGRIPCRTCAGTGYHRNVVYFDWGNGVITSSPQKRGCESCGATGVASCPACAGSGMRACSRKDAHARAACPKCEGSQTTACETCRSSDRGQGVRRVGGTAPPR